MPERIYLPPGEEVAQGDIYLDLPTVHVEKRPLRVARYWKPDARGGGNDVYVVHAERGGGPGPTGGFKWGIDKGGEEIIAHAYLAMAIVLSHDCEIEKDDNIRTLAMIRPMTDLGSEDDRNDVIGWKNYSAFPLDVQIEEPGLEPSFVDFRRITTMRPAVLESSKRHASVSDDLKKALAQRFFLYLNRPLDEGPPR